MKRHFPVYLLVLLTLFFAGCDDGKNPEPPEPPPGTNNKTYVQFVNNDNFPVSIFSNQSRTVKIADVEAKGRSLAVEADPNASGAQFFPSHHIIIDDISFTYEAVVIIARIDAGKSQEEPNTVIIPSLEGLENAEKAKPLASSAYLRIRNFGTSSLLLRYGNSELPLEGINSTILNGGETGMYKINPGPVSGYSLRKNTVTQVNFPGTITQFAASRLYSFRFDENSLELQSEQVLTLAEAIAKIERSYTVTFNSNNGSQVASQTVESGGTAYRPVSPTRSGYTFIDWYSDPALTTLYNFSTPVTAPITLYAKWSAEVTGSVEMIWVPGGSFQMGSTGNYDDESPVHTVTISGFYMGKYEVTQIQYQTVMGTNPSYYKNNNNPVERITWYDAVEFCNKLSTRDGLEPVYTITGRTPSTGYPITSATVTWDRSKNGYRLPTEAEWEYAAKGGNSSPGNYTYAGSNNVGDVAWYSGNSGSTTHAVGTKAANGLGIYDMSGNMWEWCWDWYSSTYYTISPAANPSGPSSGIERILRGGSWYTSSTDYFRLAYRYADDPAEIDITNFGFRVARGNIESFTVTFNSNDGSTVPPQNVDSGGTVTRPDNPTRSGYTFDDWYSNPGLTNWYDFSTPVGSSITLYAKWNAIVCTVAFDTGEGSEIPSQSVNYSSTATRPANPTRTGYTLDNWYSDPELTTVYNFSTPVTSHITLYAKWNIAVYTVSFNSNEGSDVDSQSVNHGGIATRPINPARSGYTFIDWYSNPGLTTLYNFYTEVTSDITLYAKWDTTPPVDVTGVSLDRTSLRLSLGQTATLIATVAPANATNKVVSWASSNSAVAAVSNGMVTAVSAGTAAITVTTVDGGKTAVCTVTVTDGGQAGIIIIPPGVIEETVDGFANGEIIISKSGTGANVEYWIEVAEGYSSYAWYVDGARKNADAWVSRYFMIRAVEYALGRHTITIVVTKNGKPYSNEQSFTVIQ